MLNRKLEAAQRRIQERVYPGFSWVVNEGVPWTPFHRPLSESTLALISTCGVYRSDTQLPFDAWNDLGDPTFREIHVDTPLDRLRVAHAHYDHAHVNADINVALPVEHFQRLVTEGAIGRLHPWMYSFMGYLPEPRQMLAEGVHILAQRLKGEDVHGAFLTPC